MIFGSVKSMKNIKPGMKVSTILYKMGLSFLGLSFPILVGVFIFQLFSRVLGFWVFIFQLLVRSFSFLGLRFQTFGKGRGDLYM